MRAFMNDDNSRSPEEISFILLCDLTIQTTTLKKSRRLLIVSIWVSLLRSHHDCKYDPSEAKNEIKLSWKSWS